MTTAGKSILQSYPIVLVTAKDKATQRDAWWYIRITDKKKMPIFLMQVKKEGCNFPDFGEILYSGFGTEPPADIRSIIESQCN